MEFNFLLLRFGPVFLVMFALLATVMPQDTGSDDLPDTDFPRRKPGNKGLRVSIRRMAKCGNDPYPYLCFRRMEELGARAEIMRSAVRSSGTLIRRSSKKRAEKKRSNKVRAERKRSSEVRAERRRAGKVRSEKNRSSKVRSSGSRMTNLRAGTKA